MDNLHSSQLPSDTLTAVGGVSTSTTNTFSAAQRGSIVRLTDTTSIPPNFNLANQFKLTLGGNRTLDNPSVLAEGQQGTINIRQDATGSRTLSYGWFYNWAGGTAGTLSTAGLSFDQLVYSVDVYQTAAVTITIATPGVVSWTNHGLDNGQKIRLTTTGALPTGLSANTTYFVSGATTNDFKLSTSLANAAAGTYIATSGSQSGVHTMTAAHISLALNKAYS